MNPGDLVACKGSHDDRTRIGIIIRVQLPRHEGPLSMDLFEVMREDGTIHTYTTAGVKILIQSLEENK